MLPACWQLRNTRHRTQGPGALAVFSGGPLDRPHQDWPWATPNEAVIAHTACGLANASRLPPTPFFCRALSVPAGSA